MKPKYASFDEAKKHFNDAFHDNAVAFTRLDGIPAAISLRTVRQKPLWRWGS